MKFTFQTLDNKIAQQSSRNYANCYSESACKHTIYSSSVTHDRASSGANAREHLQELVWSVLRFHVTHHQANRLSERNLSLESLKNVVNYADSVAVLNRGNHGGLLKKFTKTIEGKTLVAVAEIKGNNCWLATGYYAN